MTQLTFLSPAGATLAVVQAAPGQSVMRAALDANVAGIEAECGGCLTCATCHVYLDADNAARVPAATQEEEDMLGYVAAERRPGSRLSCQLLAAADLDALVVQLPERQIA